MHLIGNSLPGYGGKSHKPRTVGNRVRTFLNKFAKHHGFKGGEHSYSSYPEIEINVPRQEASFECAYHCMLMVNKHKKKSYVFALRS